MRLIQAAGVIDGVIVAGAIDYAGAGGVAGPIQEAEPIQHWGPRSIPDRVGPRMNWVGSAGGPGAEMSPEGQGSRTVTDELV